MPITTWKTIKLNKFSSPQELKTLLANSGILLTDKANNIIDLLPPRDTEVIVNTSNINLSKIVVSNTNSLIDITNSIKTSGFALCPSDFGVHLRLVYLDQPLGEWIYIAMNPIKHNNKLYVFRLLCDSVGFWLDCKEIDTDSNYYPGPTVILIK